MALETTTKRRSNFRSTGLKSILMELKRRFTNGSPKKVRMSSAKIGTTISEFREKELAKFDSGFTAKAHLYTRKFFWSNLFTLGNMKKEIF